MTTKLQLSSPIHTRGLAVVLLLLAAPSMTAAFASRSTTVKRHVHPRPSNAESCTHTRLNMETMTIASSAMTAIDTFWQTSPYTAAAIACGVKASAADIVAQKNTAALEEEEQDQKQEAPLSIVTHPVTEEISSQTDYKRNMAFLLYGSLYQGISQEFIYNHLYPLWFGTGNEVAVVLTKVAFDLLVQTTLLTLPMAYGIKGALFGSTPKQSFQRYLHDIQHQGLLQKYFMLWGPVQCFTFGVVPEHYRVTFIACVSFFWLIILSNISSKETPPAMLATAINLKEEAA